MPDDAAGLIDRLRKRDATLWPDGNVSPNRLGWLDVPRRMPSRGGRSDRLGRRGSRSRRWSSSAWEDRRSVPPCSSPSWPGRGRPAGRGPGGGG